MAGNEDKTSKEMLDNLPLLLDMDILMNEKDWDVVRNMDQLPAKKGERKQKDDNDEK